MPWLGGGPARVCRRFGFTDAASFRADGVGDGWSHAGSAARRATIKRWSWVIMGVPLMGILPRCFCRLSVRLTAVPVLSRWSAHPLLAALITSDGQTDTTITRHAELLPIPVSELSRVRRQVELSAVLTAAYCGTIPHGVRRQNQPYTPKSGDVVIFRVCEQRNQRAAHPDSV